MNVMKKNVLSFFMLILCIGILPSKTFAQEAVGSSSGLEGTFVSSCKRNNGNGTSAGFAEVRLNFSDKNLSESFQLIEIAHLTTGELLSTDESVVMGGGWGDMQKGYTSFALNFNIPARVKLKFHFRWNGGDFWIAEM